MLPVRVPSCEMLCGKRSLMPRSPDQTNRTNMLIDRALCSPHHASGMERQGAQRGQTLFIVAQNGVRGVREGLNTFNFNFTEL